MDTATVPKPYSPEESRTPSYLYLAAKLAQTEEILKGARHLSQLPGYESTPKGPVTVAYQKLLSAENINNPQAQEWLWAEIALPSQRMLTNFLIEAVFPEYPPEAKEVLKEHTLSIISSWIPTTPNNIGPEDVESLPYKVLGLYLLTRYAKIMAPLRGTPAGEIIKDISQLWKISPEISPLGLMEQLLRNTINLEDIPQYIREELKELIEATQIDRSSIPDIVKRILRITPKPYTSVGEIAASVLSRHTYSIPPHGLIKRFRSSKKGYIPLLAFILETAYLELRARHSLYAVRDIVERLLVLLYIEKSPEEMLIQLSHNIFSWLRHNPKKVGEYISALPPSRRAGYLRLLHHTFVSIHTQTQHHK